MCHLRWWWGPVSIVTSYLCGPRCEHESRNCMVKGKLAVNDQSGLSENLSPATFWLKLSPFHFNMESVFVIYCCVTNYPWTQWFKITVIINLSEFPWVRNLGVAKLDSLPPDLSWGCHEDVEQDYALIWMFSWGRTHVWTDSCACWLDSVLCGLLDRVPLFLVGGGPSSVSGHMGSSLEQNTAWQLASIRESKECSGDRGYSVFVTISQKWLLCS